MKVPIMTAAEAIECITSHSVLLTDGFIGGAFPEELAVALEQKFLKTGEPNQLTLFYCAGQGDGEDRGLNHLGYDCLIKRVIGGHWGLVPKIQKLAIENKIEAYNLPQGVLSHLLRDTAAGKPGTITHVGLNTFVDPRIEGGKISSITKEDLVQVINLNQKEFLFYHSIPIDFAFLRGTYADENGNISMDKEGFFAEMLSAAAACRNSGGKVIVQVEQIVKAGSLDPRMVKIPGIYVDIVVLASKPEYHMQTFSEQYNPSYSGEVKGLLGSMKNLETGVRKIICRRAAYELRRGSVINLGIGMPEGIAAVANEENVIDEFVMTVEAGPIGGVPSSGLSFGCSANPEAIIDQACQFDFYHGGGLDMAFLGMAQVDQTGNVNVSKFGSKIPGCGGFIDITQNAKKVVYCGTFTTNGLETDFEDGNLIIRKEGKNKKFVKGIDQITFSAKTALSKNQQILYVTERAVFKLTDQGITLIEIAPGIDLEREILMQMEFKPVVSDTLKMMDKSLFKPEKIGLKIS